MNRRTMTDSREGENLVVAPDSSFPTKWAEAQRLIVRGISAVHSSYLFSLFSAKP
jgi:hypothetical protein